MNAIRLYHANGGSAEAAYCEKCHLIYRTEEEAEKCCQPYKCSECGKEIEKYHSICWECVKIKDIEREKQRFEKAEKVTEWDGWLYSDQFRGYNEGYFRSIDEFLDELSDLGWENGVWDEEVSEEEKVEIPTYLWTCSENRFVNLDYDNILESLHDVAYEDWDPCQLSGDKEFKEAIKKFNELNQDQVAFEPNFKKALILKI